jgi:DNA polymerase-1
MLDISYQCYRASAAHPDLTRVRDELFTGGIYGFLQIVGKMVRETKATHMVACLDIKPYLRSFEYPGYKNIRATGATMTNELLSRKQATESLVLELLELAGVPLLGVAGFESDDIMGGLVLTQRHRFARLVAASNDSDLHQLLRHERFATYKDHLFDAADLLRTTGLSPEEFMVSTALTGTHNDIEGIRGVGPKTAAKAVKDPALMRKYRASHGDIIDRNLELIRLPHRELPRIDLPERTKAFNPRELYRWCNRLDIECTGAMADAFEQLDN